MSEQSEDLLRFDPADLEPGIRSAEDLPSKLYFRIGEVANLTGLKQHVLRYWETEFPAVAPKKMGSNHRMYRRKDVEAILEIKHLLYEKRFTIEGARKHIEAKPKGVAKTVRKNSGKTVEPQAMPKQQSSLFLTDEPAAAAPARVDNKLADELRAILKILGN